MDYKKLILLFLFAISCNFINAQIYTNTPEPPQARDAFERLRVSNPTNLFDAQFTYDLQPLLYDTLLNGVGATIAHDTTNRCARLGFSSTPLGGYTKMQTYQYFRYQPLKSQLVALTFNMHGGQANVTKHVGYSNGRNGIEFLLDGTTPNVRILSGTENGNEIVAQNSWNLDPLDGTGSSGDTLDLTKTQIFVIDFQALYVGRVRVGFDIGGKIIYVHEFNHANVIESPYLQTANLPLLVGMEAAATVTDSMRFICSAVTSEGGTDETLGYSFSVEGTGTAGSGTDVHILSIQPNATFNGFTNRTEIKLKDIFVIVTGNNPVYWKLGIGQALTGTTTTAVNSTYSAVNSITGTLSGSPQIIVTEGYVAATSQVKTTILNSVANKYPFTLDANGNIRDLGKFSFIAQGLGGTSTVRIVFNWEEVR